MSGAPRGRLVPRYEQLVATQKTLSVKQSYPHAPTIPAPDVTNNAPSISSRRSTSRASGPTSKRKRLCDDNPPALRSSKRLKDNHQKNNSQPTCLDQANNHPQNNSQPARLDQANSSSKGVLSQPTRLDQANNHQQNNSQPARLDQANSSSEDVHPPKQLPTTTPNLNQALPTTTPNLDQADSSSKDVPLASLPKQISTITPNSHCSTDVPLVTNQPEDHNQHNNSPPPHLDQNDSSSEDVPLASLPRKIPSSKQNLRYAFTSASQDPSFTNQQESPNQIASSTIGNLDHNHADFAPLADCPTTDFAFAVPKANHRENGCQPHSEPSILRQSEPSVSTVASVLKPPPIHASASSAAATNLPLLQNAQDDTTWSQFMDIPGKRKRSIETMSLKGLRSIKGLKQFLREHGSSYKPFHDKWDLAQMCISICSRLNDQIPRTSRRLLRPTASPTKARSIPQLDLQIVEPLPQKRPQSPPDFPSPTKAPWIPKINFQNVAPLAQKRPRSPPDFQPHNQSINSSLLGVHASDLSDTQLHRILTEYGIVCNPQQPRDNLENHHKDLLSLEEPKMVRRVRRKPDLTAKPNLTAPRPTRRNPRSKPRKSKAVFKPHSIYDDTLVVGTDTDMDNVHALIPILPQQVQHLAKHPSISHQQLADSKNQSCQFSPLTPACGGNSSAEHIQVDHEESAYITDLPDRQRIDNDSNPGTSETSFAYNPNNERRKNWCNHRIPCHEKSQTPPVESHPHLLTKVVSPPEENAIEHSGEGLWLPVEPPSHSCDDPLITQQCSFDENPTRSVHGRNLPGGCAQYPARNLQSNVDHHVGNDELDDAESREYESSLEYCTEGDSEYEGNDDDQFDELDSDSPKDLLPSADQASSSKYQDSGREKQRTNSDSNDEIGAQSSPRNSDWIPGHLLSKKNLSSILSKHGILYKTQDKKKVLVDLYESLQASKSGQQGQLEPEAIGATAHERQPKNYHNCDKQGLVKILAPFPVATSNLSKAKLVLLCEAYNKMNEPLTFRPTTKRSDTFQLDATDQSPIEMDPVEPASEQPFSRPVGGLGQFVQSPPSAKRLNLIPSAVSEPSIAASSERNGATGLLKRLTELQLQNNNLLQLQTSILERSHREAMSRIEDFTPGFKRLVEWADTNIKDYDPSDQHAQHTSSPKRASPSKPSPAKTPRGGDFADMIRKHVATLFGLKPGERIPPPATEAKRQQWRTPQNVDFEMDVSYDNSGAELEFADPGFPYPEGPGHPEATPETLKIIREEMNRYGISAFRPDLAKPFSDPENMFLWSFAVNTFVELIERGEYTNVSSELYNCSTIEAAMNKHVVNSWQRTYRKRNHKKPEATQLAEKRARQVTRVNKNRGASIYRKTELRHLESIFKACCSEDETDSEDDSMSVCSETSTSDILSDDGMSIDSLQKQQPVNSSQASSKPVFTNKKPKRCKVMKYYWRSADVDDLMIMLDAVGFTKNVPKRHSGPSPATRTRLQNPVISDTKPKIGLPIDFYDQDWLATLPQYEVTALEIISEPAIPISTTLLQNF
ncbi:hypothetical protein Pst134EB_028317 [Puccinia striiformis f. sp. tritici]|nr:hypothetical protein Pst134EB_028317 [Puccinia striiformis f. sp. tritici]